MSTDNVTRIQSGTQVPSSLPSDSPSPVEAARETLYRTSIAARSLATLTRMASQGAEPLSVEENGLFLDGLSVLLGGLHSNLLDTYGLLLDGSDGQEEDPERLGAAA